MEHQNKIMPGQLEPGMRRKCWIRKYNDLMFALVAEPTPGNLGSTLGSIRRDPGSGTYSDGTYPWSLILGGMVQARTMDEAAQRWAEHVNWELCGYEKLHA